MGRYVPPDVEGTTSGNRLHRKHALGARASKLASHGALTVRFEMPFAVWCNHCPKPTIIGQGVRFNSEKKKVGNYYSTPIYSFRMRHADCGGAIEIRTDPQNTAYVVTEGGKKRDTGEDKACEGQIVTLTDKERDQLRGNAFAKLEKTIEDKQQLAATKRRIEELADASTRLWEDPYEQNRKLRRTFRVGRKEREKEAKSTEDLRDRMSLGIVLLPSSEEDAKRAALMDFGHVANDEHKGKALSRPLFDTSRSKQQASASTGRKKLKSEIAATQMRESLVSEIVGNTRAAQDPFLTSVRGDGEAWKASLRIPGIKRKRDEACEIAGRGEESEKLSTSTALVNYDSD